MRHKSARCSPSNAHITEESAQEFAIYKLQFEVSQTKLQYLIYQTNSYSKKLQFYVEEGVRK